MPYYVYRISADRQELTPVQMFEKFKPAMQCCRALRQEQPAEDTSTVRMIFAKDEKTAEGLLKSNHKSSGPVEEWEV